jgi:hypothetical protein
MAAPEPEPSEPPAPEMLRKHCRVCGQEFDLRDIDQVFHHDATPHSPLAAND